MLKDKLSSVYNYIKSKNRDFTVDENTFRQDMSDDLKRAKTYSYLKNVNSEFTVDYNTFSSDMGFNGKQQIPTDKTNAYSPETDPLVQGAVGAAYSIPSKVPLRPTGVESTIEQPTTEIPPQTQVQSSGIPKPKLFQADITQPSFIERGTPGTEEYLKTPANENEFVNSLALKQSYDKSAQGDYEGSQKLLDEVKISDPSKSYAYDLSAHNKKQLYLQTKNPTYLDEALNDINIAITQKEQNKQDVGESELQKAEINSMKGFNVVAMKSANKYLETSGVKGFDDGSISHSEEKRDVALSQARAANIKASVYRNLGQEDLALKEEEKIKSFNAEAKQNDIEAKDRSMNKSLLNFENEFLTNPASIVGIVTSPLLGAEKGVETMAKGVIGYTESVKSDLESIIKDKNLTTSEKLIKGLTEPFFTNKAGEEAARFASGAAELGMSAMAYTGGGMKFITGVGLGSVIAPETVEKLMQPATTLLKPQSERGKLGAAALDYLVVALAMGAAEKMADVNVKKVFGGKPEELGLNKFTQDKIANQQIILDNARNKFEVDVDALKKYGGLIDKIKRGEQIYPGEAELIRETISSIPQDKYDAMAKRYGEIKQKTIEQDQVEYQRPQADKGLAERKKLNVLDFDETLYDNEKGELTDLGKKYEGNKDIKIVTGNPDKTFIAEKLGIDESQITSVEGNTPEIKAENKVKAIEDISKETGVKTQDMTFTDDVKVNRDKVAEMGVEVKKPIDVKTISQVSDRTKYVPFEKDNSALIKLPIDFVEENQIESAKVERGGVNEKAGRIDEAKTFLSSEQKELKPSYLSVVEQGSEKGKLMFADGRHRNIAAKELGATESYYEIPTTKKSFDSMYKLLSENDKTKNLTKDIDGTKTIDLGDNNYLVKDGNVLYKTDGKSAWKTSGDTDIMLEYPIEKVKPLLEKTKTEVIEITGKEKAISDLEQARQAFKLKRGTLSMGGLEAIPELVDLVKAYVKVKAYELKDFIDEFRKDFPEEKEITDEHIKTAFEEALKEDVKTEPATQEGRPDITGVKQEVIDQEMKNAGIEPSKYVKADQQLFAEAVAYGQKGRGFMVSLADAVREKPQLIEDYQIVAFGIEKGKMEKEMMGLLEELSAARRDMKVAETVALEGQIDALQKQLNTINLAFAESISPQYGRGFRAFQFMNDIMSKEYTEPFMMAKMKSLSKDGYVSPEMTTRVKELSKEILEYKNKLEQSDKELENYKKQIKELKVQIESGDKEGIAEIQKQIKREKKLERREKIKTESRKREEVLWNDIAELAKQSRTMASGGFVIKGVPELGVKIGLIAKERIVRGAVDLASVVDGIYDQLKKHFPDIDKQDIVDTIRDNIFEKKERPTKTKTQLQIELADLRKEKNLLKQIDDLESGKLKGAKARAVENNPKIIELKAKVKELKQKPEYKNEVYRKSIDTKIKTLQKRIDDKDFDKPDKQQLKLEQASFERLRDYEYKKLEFEQLKAEHEYEQKTGYVKTMEYIGKFQRAALLSGLSTLGKLTSAAVQRALIFTPVENFIGAGWGKIISPLVKSAMQKEGALMREGKFYSDIEAKAFKDIFTKQTIQDFTDAWMKGKIKDVDIYGKAKYLIEDPQKSARFLEYVGRLHYALKAMPKRNEFSRAYNMFERQAKEQGVDVSLSSQKFILAAKAYQEASKAIFMQDNAITDAYKNLLHKVEKKSPAAGLLMRMTFPIVKVPTNFVLETGRYNFGLFEGAFRTIGALKKGIDNCTPEQVDKILLAFKKGTVGAGFFLLGYYNSENIGGYYQRGEKRPDEDVSAGGLKLFGFSIPKVFLHTPALEMLQIGSTVARLQKDEAEDMDRELTLAEKSGSFLSSYPKTLTSLVEQIPFVNSQSTEPFTKAGKSFAKGEYGKTWDAIKEIAGQKGATFLPRFIQEQAAWMDRKDGGYLFGDEEKRATKEWYDQFIKGVPVWRKSLPTKEEGAKETKIERAAESKYKSESKSKKQKAKEKEKRKQSEKERRAIEPEVKEKYEEEYGEPYPEKKKGTKGFGGFNKDMGSSFGGF